MSHWPSTTTPPTEGWPTNCVVAGSCSRSVRYTTALSWSADAHTMASDGAAFDILARSCLTAAAAARAASLSDE